MCETYEMFEPFQFMKVPRWQTKLITVYRTSSYDI